MSDKLGMLTSQRQLVHAKKRQVITRQYDKKGTKIHTLVFPNKLISKHN